jgi:glycolate oxidase FAD binding subunit
MADAFEAALKERIVSATEPFVIRGGGTRSFLYARSNGQPLGIAAHDGVVDYQPSELVITVRAGTTLAELDRTLAVRGQMLAADPPRFGAGGTLGGALATGMSGPGRPWYGSLRDVVLGVRVLSGHGEILDFGGKVLKNVAGYDVSRLQVGAHGTLGVILGASLRLLPVAQRECTLAFDCDRADAHTKVVAWGRTPVPMTATVHDGDRLYVRLSGTEAGVAAAARSLGGEALEAFDWGAVRDQRLTFFTAPRRPGAALWRISLPPAADYPDLNGDWLTEWGGALRWCRTADSGALVRASVKALGGHAHEYSKPGGFAELDSLVARYHKRLKDAFDPRGLFNPGRIPGVA